MESETVYIILNSNWFGEVAYPPKADPPWAGWSIMYYVYILFSKEIQKKYIGSTEDLKQRIKDHNSGKSEFTSKGMPWKLIYYEAFLNKTGALREEKFLKSGKGRERIKNLLHYGEVA